MLLVNASKNAVAYQLVQRCCKEDPLNRLKSVNQSQGRSMGIYLRVLYALQLDDDILLLAKEDKMGKALQDLSLKTRERASKKE